MTAQVVGMHGERVLLEGEPNTALISLLSDMLEKAKRGELHSVVGAGRTLDGGTVSFRSEHQGALNVYAMLGGIEAMKASYIRHHELEL